MNRVPHRFNHRLLVALAATAVLGIVALGSWQVAQRTVLASAPQLAADTTLGPTTVGAFNVRVLDDSGRRIFYRVFLPRDFTTAKRWPVIIALHGGANRGTDNVRQIAMGMGPLLREGSANIPAVIVFPQSPDNERGADFSAKIVRILDQTLEEFNGDPKRVYLTGMSYGASLAYDLAYKYPDRFAALVPIASTIQIKWTTGRMTAPKDSVYRAVAQRVRAIPIWVFQGDADELTPVALVRENVKVFQDAGVSVRYTEFPGGKHNVWDRVYRMPELYAWLFAQHR
jgi:predicted peptidase